MDWRQSYPSRPPGVPRKHHRGDRIRDISASAAALRQLSASIASLAGNHNGCPAFKILPAVSTEDIVISCDPLEVIDALGLDDDVAVMILREALEGLCDAHFGRIEQVRLALVVTGLLVQIVKLRQQGLNAWSICQALRQVERLALEALENISAQKLAKDVLSSASLDEHPVAAELPAPGSRQGLTAVTSRLPMDLDSDEDDDDVGWFFSDTPVRDPAVCADAVPPPVLAAHPLPSAVQTSDEHGVQEQGLEAVCAVLHRKCCGARRSNSVSKGKEQCFVYASVRPRLQHDCRLLPGVVCHVPRDHLCANNALIQKLVVSHPLTPPGNPGSSGCAAAWPQPSLLRHAIFLEADLEGAAYETATPADRRLAESWAPTAASPASWLVSRTSEREKEVAESVSKFIDACKVEIIFIAGDASSAIVTVCKGRGTLLVSGLPARLVHALAEEAGCEVLRGLPSADSQSYEQSRWVAQRALQVELRELSAAQRQNCFSFPLLGYRQPLLPHQSSVGEDVRGPCLEVWACASELFPNGGIVQTVLLEASCEPVLRSLHADLSDQLFTLLRAETESAETASRHLPGAGEWAQVISNALADEAVKCHDSAPDAKGSDLLVAPWMALPLDTLANAAALQHFSEAFEELASHESQQTAHYDVDGTHCEDETSINDEIPTVDEDSFTSVATVLRRAVRLATVLTSLDDFG